MARIAGVKVKVDPATMRVKVGGLPEGVMVAPRRIVVAFTSAKEAVARLFAIAQALGKRLGDVRPVGGRGRRRRRG